MITNGHCEGYIFLYVKTASKQKQRKYINFFLIVKTTFIAGKVFSKLHAHQYRGVKCWLDWLRCILSKSISPSPVFFPRKNEVEGNKRLIFH